MEEKLVKFPFLTLGTYLDKEYLGIIGNSDNQITSMYLYDILPNEELKKLFLLSGDQWWWETNRQIPINISLSKKWIFRDYMILFNTKDFIIKSGPCISLDNIIKKIKRTNIQLRKNNK